MKNIRHLLRKNTSPAHNYWPLLPRRYSSRGRRKANGKARGRFNKWSGGFRRQSTFDLKYQAGGLGI